MECHIYIQFLTFVAKLQLLQDTYNQNNNTAIIIFRNLKRTHSIKNMIKKLIHKYKLKQEWNTILNSTQKNVDKPWKKVHF